MNEEAAYLVVEQGPYQYQQYLLNKAVMIIGRGANNDIVIVDPEISRQHAQILRHGAQDYAIQDMGSTNGTFVNGRRIGETTPLPDGATINLGESIILTFHLPEPVYEDEDDTPTGEIIVPQPVAPPPAQPASPPYQPPAHQPVQPIYRPPARPSASGQPAYTPSAPPAAPRPGAPWTGTAVPGTAGPGTAAPDAIYPELAVPSEPRRRVHPVLLGCGILLLTAFLCTATLFFLDAYDNGRLLYCGGLRPFWQFLLGPFGFAPLCG